MKFYGLKKIAGRHHMKVSILCDFSSLLYVWLSILLNTVLKKDIIDSFV